MTLDLVRVARAALLAGAGLLGSCGYGSLGGVAGGAGDDPGADPGEQRVAVSCTGRCEGLSDVLSLWRDPREITVDRLMVVGAGFATDELNGQLADLGNPRVRLGRTSLYTTDARAASDPTLGNLDALAAGLATRFGERELTAEVNRIRRDRLRDGPDTLYAESSFELGAGFSHGWGLEVGQPGGAGVYVGFDAGVSIQGKVVNAYPTVGRALYDAPLSAAQELRGFVLPRGLTDLRAMKPGESFALRGTGHLALSVGVGVPLLVADPSALVSYSIVLSAGVSARVDGTLDVQAVRVGNEQVVVDVGVDVGGSVSGRIALEDGFGIPKLARQRVNVGRFDVGIGEIAERALVRKLEGAVGFSARVEGRTGAERVTVARLRFSLDGASPELEQALAQALRGDIRLAQALAARGDAGVVAELDAVRSGHSTTGYAGIELLGMKFFREHEHATGSAVVQTPGGAQALLFDSLHDSSGWFFTSHGRKRVRIAGVTFPSDGSAPRNDANIVFQIVEGDEFMEREKLLDHLDGLIVTMAGEDALRAIEEPGNELQRMVVRRCSPTNAWDPCIHAMLVDPEAVALRERARTALETATASLEPSTRALVRRAGELRLQSQNVREYPATFVGPPSSVVLTQRFDDALLERLFTTQDGRAFRAALVRFLSAANVSRDDAAGPTRDRGAIESRYGAKLDALAALFDEHADRYQRLLSAERAELEGIGSVGTRAIELGFVVDRADAPVLESAVVRSVAQRRAEVASSFFDAAREAADGCGPFQEQLVGYALLAMTPPELYDLRFDLRMDLRDSFSQDLDEYRAAGFAPMDVTLRGPATAPIGVGVFQVDSVTRITR